MTDIELMFSVVAVKLRQFILHLLTGAYTKIIATVEEARQAALKAVEAADKAFEKASPPTGDLRTKVDQVIYV